ncbi:MAG TPA: hypothetical protein VN207_08460 [Ktedonobacteraceae bacterium]|nr:hypothetical protein [Ktedonobacteraceae bacterium]
MINYTSQVIETVTLSNTIELTDEQLAGVVGGHDGHDWGRGGDRREHNDDWGRGWHGDDDDWRRQRWGWHNGWR